MYYESSEPVAARSTYSLLPQVFLWMCIALIITGITSLFVFYNDQVRDLVFSKPMILYGLMIAQIIVVLIFSFFIYSLSYPVALLLFILYSILTGMTLSVIFVVYTMSSIASTFFIAAAMFGGMALWGMITKRDLSSMGSFLTMALWGLIIAMIVNLFLKSSQFNFFISICGVIIFTGLTAFDVQRIKNISASLAQQQAPFNKIVLLCALTLYLDFINLFLSLLQLTGNRNKD